MPSSTERATALLQVVARSVRSITKGRRAYYAIAGIAALLGLVFVAYVYLIPPKNTLVLREDGWHPRTLLVPVGQQVTFVNRSSHAFWPASNSHPQHDLYAEFDSGHAIQPGQSWSFVFDRPGKWGFHDHLRSFYTGIITVGKDAA